MADDKRDGDDLFEDLDKFFAPIKDVDWDEPAAAGARETPSEEHVAVRSNEGAGASGAPMPEPPKVGAPEAEPDQDDDTSWYDTSVIETIEGLDVDEPEEPVVAEEVVEIVDEPTPDPHAGQPGLFASDADDDIIGPDTDTAEWPTVEEDEAREESAVSTDVGGMAEIDEEPSEDDLEAATEHFAGSVRDTFGVAPEEAEEEVEVVVGAPDGGDAWVGSPEAEEVEGDILADLREPEDEPQTVMVGGGEGLGGPSWQESASVEVGADLDHRGPNPDERDVPAAFLTGIVLVGVALGTLLLSKGLFAIVATAVVLLGQGELYGVMVRRHKQPATAVGLITGALMMAGAYFHGEPAVLAMFALGVVATFLWFMAVPAAHRKDTLLNIGLTLLNVAWIPLMASYLLVTLDQGDGTSLVITVIGLTFVFDTAAFLGGSVTGGQFFPRPLAPSVSPKKSIEGVIIATLVTAFVSVALVTSFVTPFEGLKVDSLVLAVVVAAAATFGDLAESLVKRDLGIKDMSGALPGHGGVLDRIDSLLFVAPAAFLFFRVIFS